MFFDEYFMALSKSESYNKIIMIPGKVEGRMIKAFDNKKKLFSSMSWVREKSQVDAVMEKILDVLFGRFTFITSFTGKDYFSSSSSMMMLCTFTMSFFSHEAFDVRSRFNFPSAWVCSTINTRASFLPFEKSI
jgi:hypothetical protein